jgi:two-component system, OmpR family, phosphate regulon sensor histidine kinase PhoR
MIRNEKLSYKESIKQHKTKDLEKTSKDVIDWAREKSKEIEDLKHMAVYRREYVGNVSHELKTPIFNIQGYVLTLLDGGMDDASINKKYLLKTEESIDKMISIIEDLEEISKLESGELALQYVDFDLLKLSKEIIDFLEMKAQNKNIKIYLREDYEKPINVSADKKRITQVLSNLIENAINYTNEEGEIKISFFDMVDHYLIEVTDTGIGIESDEIPRLFERFYRTEKSRTKKQGGTGLGLSIVKHIIEAHNQTINVRSKTELGSTFAFTLKKGK